MIPDNLEDLLHSSIFDIEQDGSRIQDVLLKIEAELRSGGKNFVITSIFSSKTALIGKAIALSADSKTGSGVKIVHVEKKESVLDHKIEVVYYDPAEVEQFVAVEGEI